MEAPLTHTHHDLIEACRAGRRDAQFDLYKLYSRAMYNTALRMVQNPHDAEDLLQSIFISSVKWFVFVNQNIANVYQF